MICLQLILSHVHSCPTSCGTHEIETVVLCVQASSLWCRVPPRARWRHQPLSIGAGFAPKFLSLLILVDMVSHTGISPQPPLNQLAASHGAQ